MSTNLLITTLLFLAALSSTVFLLVYLFVRKYPKHPVFWKRSDYVYFTAAILGTTLGIVDQSSSGLQSEVVRGKKIGGVIALLVIVPIMLYHHPRDYGR